MSKCKITKYLEKPLVLNKPLTKHLNLLSDSKGNYLKPYTEYTDKYGHSVDFACKKGTRFCYSYIWLEKILPGKVQKYKQVVFYVFLGTCDLTVRQGKYIRGMSGKF